MEIGYARKVVRQVIWTKTMETAICQNAIIITTNQHSQHYSVKKRVIKEDLWEWEYCYSHHSITTIQFHGSVLLMTSDFHTMICYMVYINGKQTAKVLPLLPRVCFCLCCQSIQLHHHQWLAHYAEWFKPFPVSRFFVVNSLLNIRCVVTFYVNMCNSVKGTQLEFEHWALWTELNLLNPNLTKLSISISLISFPLKTLLVLFQFMC